VRGCPGGRLGAADAVLGRPRSRTGMAVTCLCFAIPEVHWAQPAAMRLSCSGSGMQGCGVGLYTPGSCT
jgi:hypothetical protein